MNQKTIMILVALPFIAFLFELMFNLFNNPIGTIHAIYSFQVNVYDYVFRMLRTKET